MLVGFSIALISLIVPHVQAFEHPHTPPHSVEQSGQSVIQIARQYDAQGRELYQQNQYSAAIHAWQQAMQGYGDGGGTIEQAKICSNISLAYQKLGVWGQAQQALDQGFDYLDNLESSEQHLRRRTRILAQILSAQASLYFEKGQSHAALETWKQAELSYAEVADELGHIRAQLNQAQVIQELGYHRRVIGELRRLSDRLQDQFPTSPLRSLALRQLGDALRLIGNGSAAQQALQESLVVAQNQGNTAEIAATLLSLGRTAWGGQRQTTALELYHRALSYAAEPALNVRIELAQLRALVVLEKWHDAQQLWPTLKQRLSSLPHTRQTVYDHIDLAQQLMALAQHDPALSSGQFATLPDGWAEASNVLSVATQMAHDLGDTRSETYALGCLGHLYELMRQWAGAKTLTHQALDLAQSIGADDIAYRWQWQLGRILHAEQDAQGSIAAYRSAIAHLTSLRGDLVAINAEAQFRFQEEVEPVYRELVELLLTPSDTGGVSQTRLGQARDVMESLQIAELDNFFQEACLEKERVGIDQMDPHAAIIYPIILSDRLDIILSLPDQSLRHYSTPISQPEFTQLMNDFRANLVIRSRLDFQAQSQQLYDWLLRPMASTLENHEIRTLVFVLDGPLRQIPMAVLHDGSHYLIETYQISVAPGLTLVDPTPFHQQDASVLMAGLSQARHGFSALTHVNTELNAIQNITSSTVLLNEKFTSDRLRQKVEHTDFPFIHIASHGQFSSNPNDTFLVTWDKYLGIQDLQRILQTGSQTNRANIELLILSACETAAGDPKAPLGLAGMAVRAGARSTLATLWAVNDGVTAQFMARFYRYLESGLTKAESLRQTQLWLLQQPRHNHPLYWAPYVLIGSWR